MRSSRSAKNKNRKTYIRNILLTFLVIIPAAAILSSFALQLTIWKENNIDKAAAIFAPKEEDTTAFKYNFDIAEKQLYRIEIKKFESYEAAEAQITAMKKKKLNGFIVKEQGYLTAFGLFWNKSQGDTAVKYLARKNIESFAVPVNINGVNITYEDVDKNLVDLATGIDGAILKIVSEKSALSLESLYSEKEISGKSLDIIIEYETKLAKYLNYLKDIKTSETNSDYKKNLENLINEVLVDKLQADSSYDYYSLQNSLMNQGEALIKFYEKLSI